MPGLQGSLSEASCQQPQTSGTSVEGADRIEAVPPSKTMGRRSAPRDCATPTTEFGSTLEPRDRTMWDKSCSATDYETGHLKGDVGTPEDPMFTYEEAVHQRHAE